MDLILHGEVPSKKNSRINTGSGRSFPSRRYTSWHDMAVIEIRRQWSCWRIDIPCKLSLEFVHGDLRRRDSDNGLSSVLDTLVDAGVLEDDSWAIVREIRVSNRYEKNNPHCIVRIKEYKEE